jgi:hypothetical protein
MKCAGAFLLAALLGCATTTVRTDHVLTGAAHHPYEGDVRIVMDEAPANGSYEEVAVVSASGDHGSATLGAVLQALQREAASLGCDSVIHVRYEQGMYIASATGVAVRTK